MVWISNCKEEGTKHKNNNEMRSKYLNDNLYFTMWMVDSIFDFGLIKKRLNIYQPYSFSNLCDIKHLSLFIDMIRYILFVRTAMLLNIFLLYTDFLLRTHSVHVYSFLLPFILPAFICTCRSLWYSRCTKSKICELHFWIMKHFYAKQFMIMGRDKKFGTIRLKLKIGDERCKI